MRLPGKMVGAGLHAFDGIVAPATIDQLGNSVPPPPPPGRKWLKEPAELAGLPPVIIAAAAGLVSPVLTEGGLADAFVKLYGRLCRYDCTAKRWYWFHGDIWRPDDTGIALLLMRHLCESVASSIDDAAARGRIIKLQFAKAAIEFAKIDRAVVVGSDVWNRDPWKFATPGGTVDLRTGQLLQADPADLITQMGAVAPSEEANCPIWLQFLHFALGGDEGLIEFFRRWLGYCLSGDIREQALVFIFGEGGNGKSILINVFLKLVGTYGTTAPMQTFTVTHGNRHPNDLDALRGYRFVAANETQKGRILDEQRVKGLTAGDPQSSRGVNENFSSWPPVLKLMFAGNEKPRLQSVGDAMKRRFNLAEFCHKPATPDLTLESKLLAEGPSIMRWAIDGCIAWQQSGLQRPQAIIDATAAYFTEQDSNAAWLAERAILEPDARERPDALRDDLNRWLKSAGEDQLSRQMFANWIRRQKGLQAIVVRGANFIRGIRLRNGLVVPFPTGGEAA